MNIPTAVRRRIASSRRTIALAVASLAVVAPMIATAGPAQATTPSVITPYGTCDRYSHQMTIGASVVLSDAYPSGTTVAVRYAYWWVTASGTTLSAVQYTPWVLYNARPSTTYVGELIISNQANAIPSVSKSVTGYLKTASQMGVWNGRGYDYSPWAYPTQYTNLGGQYQIYRSTGSVCIAS